MSQLDSTLHEILYKAKSDPSFKALLLKSPGAVLADCGIAVSDPTQLRVEDNPYGGVFLALNPKSPSPATPSEDQHFMDCHHY